MSDDARVHTLACFALAALLAGCADPMPTTSAPGLGQRAAPPISNAARSGAVPHFYFLPPMVPQPTYSGTSNGTLSPSVVVCEWSGTACIATIAQFSLGSGTGSEVVRYDASAEQYVVNWHTDRCIQGPCTLDPAKVYRLRVLLGAIELGFADVDVVSKGSELRNVETSEYIGLVNGRTLPVKFRIEEGINLPTSWDAAADFSETQNPNGQWSSGWTATLNGAFHLYTTHETQDGGVIAAWRDDTFLPQITPTFQKNISTSTIIYGVLPGQTILHSGCVNGELSVLRWTAPVSRSYSVSAQFLSGNFGQTEAWIYRNQSALIFAAGPTSANPAFSGTVALTAGDYVDFIVGPAGDGCGADSTPTLVTIY